MIGYSEVKDVKLFLQYRSRVAQKLAERAKESDNYKYDPWFKTLVDSVLDFQEIDYNA